MKHQFRKHGTHTCRCAKCGILEIMYPMPNPSEYVLCNGEVTKTEPPCKERNDETETN